jgi:phosphoserine phosphatase
MNQQLTKIILVRHGRSTYNEQGRYQGSSNESVLTKKGLETAYLTGLALKQFKFDAVYTSPLTRVQQTTQEIVSAFNNPHDNLLSLNSRLSPGQVRSDSRLQEVNMATWEGLTYKEVKENFAQDYHCWEKTPHLFAFSSVNHSQQKFYPLQDLYQRAKSFLTEILNQHRGQTILIVAHGGTNRALISNAIGLSPDKYHSLQQ